MKRKITDSLYINDGIAEINGVFLPSLGMEEIEGMVLKKEDFPLDITPEDLSKINDFFLKRDEEFKKLQENTRQFIEDYFISSFLIEYNIVKKDDWEYLCESYYEKILQNLNIVQ